MWKSFTAPVNSWSKQLWYCGDWTSWSLQTRYYHSALFIRFRSAQEDTARMLVVPIGWSVVSDKLSAVLRRTKGSQQKDKLRLLVWKVIASCHWDRDLKNFHGALSGRRLNQRTRTAYSARARFYFLVQVDFARPLHIPDSKNICCYFCPLCQNFPSTWLWKLSTHGYQLFKLGICPTMYGRTGFDVVQYTQADEIGNGSSQEGL